MVKTEQFPYEWINEVEQIPAFLDEFFTNDIVKNVVEREMTKKFKDEKFMRTRCSKTWHSIIDQDTEQGLSRHLQNTLFVAHTLLSLEFNSSKFSTYEQEIIKAAALMHDYGIGIVFPHEKWNPFSKGEDERQICYDIGHLIHRHMGEWSKYRQPDCELSNFLHMCDIIASRNWILILGTDNYGFEC